MCSNLKEIDRDSLESYVIELVMNNCLKNNPAEYDKLTNLEQHSLEFRKLLRQYIKEIIVYKDYVKFLLYVDGKVRSYRQKRVKFKTVTQRYFKT